METQEHTHSQHGDVPGTILLVDTTNQGDQRAQRGGRIVLQPQPSATPEDPLNWTQPRKKLTINMVYFYAIAIGISTAAQFSIMTQISESQGLSIGQLNLGTGLMQLMQGWANLLWQPIATTYGRRGVYIVTMVLSIGPVIWTPFSKGAGQWYAHRIILGIVCSPVEALPELSVQDLFFAHERGTYMALYTFILFGSNFLAPFLAGFITDGMSWEWVMYFATMLMVICSAVMVFFTEETIFFRQTTEGMGPGSVMEAGPAKESGEDTAADSTVEYAGESELTPAPKRLSLQHLRLFNRRPGRPTRKQMMLKSWRSLKILIFFPNILWAGLLYGTNLAWYSVINATISMLLGSPPYNFRPTMVGVAYLSPLAFGAVASGWAGTLADSFAIYLAKRNGGVREPEHRLWGLSVAAVMTTVGLVMWGVGASLEAHYMVLIIGIGITTFGVVCASAVSLAYAVDCFKEIAGESFVSIMLVRNTLGFAFSYAITPWIDGMGLRNCFISVSLISLCCTSTFLLMIFWGKSLRKLSASRYWRYVAAERKTAVY